MNKNILAIVMLVVMSTLSIYIAFNISTPKAVTVPEMLQEIKPEPYIEQEYLGHVEYRKVVKFKIKHNGIARNYLILTNDKSDGRFQIIELDK